MATTIQKHTIERPVDHIFSNLLGLYEKMSEWFWFVLCFFLFVALGPFSAPVALIALYQVSKEVEGQQEPESIA